MGGMGFLFSDLRQAARVLRKSPGFTLTAVAALGLGIAANTAIFSVVNAVLLKPLPYPEPDRIVRVLRSYPSGNSDSCSIPKFMVWKSQEGVFEAIAAYDFSGPGLNLSGGDQTEQLKGVHVSNEFFRVFGYAPHFGRSFTADEDRPGGAQVAVISDGLWKRRFGADPGILERPIVLSGEPTTVIGVAPAAFEPDPPADVWLPLKADPNSANQGHYLSIAARLRSGISLEAAKARMKIAAQQFRAKYPRSIDANESVTVAPFQEHETGNVRPALLILVGAVGFVLLIACANLANLLLARATGRQKEIAIRSALGASQSRMVRQLLTESVLLACISGLAGLLLGSAGVRALLAISPGDLPRIHEAGSLPVFALLDWRVVLYSAVVAFSTGIVFGLYPALQLSRPDMNTTLKEASGRSGTGRRQGHARAVLVVSEIALALILVIGAMLLIRTFVGLRSVKTGIDARNVLTMQMSFSGSKFGTTAQVDQFEREAVRRIEGLPGVLAAAPAAMLPLQGDIDLSFNIEGRPPEQGSMYNGDEYWRFAGPHFFDVFKIPVLRGRGFDERDTGKTAPVLVVNESFAKKYFPQQDAIGKRIIIGRNAGPELEDTWREIVGVVGDTREAGLNRPPQPTMYIPSAQVPDPMTRFANSVLPVSWAIRTTGAPLSLSTAVQRQFLALDSQMAVAKVQTMEKLLSRNTARESFNMMLLSVFAGIALLLAAIGIYGLVSYAVEQRTHEIGIRLALGAGHRQMIGMVLKNGLRLAAAGVAIGLVASFLVTKLLSKLLFGVQAHDPATYAAVALALGTVALAASYVPALRVAKVDPVIALRYE